MLHQERSKVQAVFALASRIPLDQADLQGHWGKYACLVCAGYLEVALRLVIRQRVEKKSTPEIQRFVIHSLDSIQNPKAERFCKVIRSFSDDWGNSLDTFFQQNNQVKDAIDSIMANRHLIAHGRPCSISIGRAYGFYNQADKAITFIDSMINPAEI
jgi:RiboL-PSP-HEPN